MKISIITVVYNNQETIQCAIDSVLSQDYDDVEYVIVDGASIDGTIEVIEKVIGSHPYKNIKFISEKDEGMYDAINKGIKIASGDIVGILHSDDFFADDRVIEKVMDTFEKTNADCLWGDLLYVDKNNTEKVIRYWRSCEYRDGFFKKGWMPPHPAFFAKKQVYEKYGYFDTDLEISADYEIMLRFLHKYRISTGYLPEVLVRMRLGGLSNSSLKNVVRKSREDLKAWKLNDLKGRVPAVFLKNISKIPQFFVK